MSEFTVVTIAGPYESGYFQILPDGDAPFYTSRPDRNELEEATQQLNDAVGEFAAVGADWDLRGDDEKRPLLEALRTAGIRMVEAFTAGDNADLIRAAFREATMLRLHTTSSLRWEFFYLGDAEGAVELQDFLGAWAVVGGPAAAGSRGILRGSRSALPHSAWDRVPTGSAFGLAEDGRLGSARTGSEARAITQHGFTLTRLKAIGHNIAGEREFRAFVENSTVLTHFNSHAVDDHEDRGVRTSALFVSTEFPVANKLVSELPMVPNSIVVLNCCRGFSLQFGRSRSLAHGFAGRDVAIVVATTERVDDLYATRWAQRFYGALRELRNVASAMLRARRELLAIDGNPMALLYGFVGISNAALPKAA